MLRQIFIKWWVQAPIFHWSHVLTSSYLCDLKADDSFRTRVPPTTQKSLEFIDINFILNLVMLLMIAVAFACSCLQYRFRWQRVWPRQILTGLAMTLAIVILAQDLAFVRKRRGNIGALGYVFIFAIAPLVLCFMVWEMEGESPPPVMYRSQHRDDRSSPSSAGS